MVPVAGIAPSELRDTYMAGRGSDIHAALDIMARRNTPVVAADDGTILQLRHNDAGGITIYELDAGEQFVYYYAHLERYADSLRQGMGVRQGDVIGYVGTTGNAPPDLPHLHFQLMRYVGHGQWWGGVPLNPLPFLVRRGEAR